MKPNTGTNAAIAIKNAINKEILKNEIWEIKISKIFKFDNLPYVTVGEKN
jgi:hypothetical protein